MPDKRKLGNEAPQLWDYRKAKLLLDVLALKHDYEARGHLVSNLETLCKNWEIFPHYVMLDNVRIMDIPRTLQKLAEYVLQQGREEVAARKYPMDNVLDYPEKD